MFDAIKRALSKYNKKKNLSKIRLGICAMDKKAKSKPMREILKRLPDEIFEIIIFGDECILNQPIESWPVVDCLIAFYATKYPTEKALQYVKLRQPFMINDLETDAVLKDRRKVYQMLQQAGIEVPFHVICDRDDPDAINTIEEFDEVSL
jgi:inositol hexakisphosphate/diphosphoinositol-pentakisphosphate kinase